MFFSHFPPPKQANRRGDEPGSEGAETAFQVQIGPQGDPRRRLDGQLERAFLRSLERFDREEERRAEGGRRSKQAKAGWGGKLPSPRGGKHFFGAGGFLKDEPSDSEGRKQLEVRSRSTGWESESEPLFRKRRGEEREKEHEGEGRGKQNSHREHTLQGLQAIPHKLTIKTYRRPKDERREGEGRGVRELKPRGGEVRGLKTHKGLKMFRAEIPAEMKAGPD